MKSLYQTLQESLHNTRSLSEGIFDVNHPDEDIIRDWIETYCDNFKIDDVKIRNKNEVHINIESDWARVGIRGRNSEFNGFLPGIKFFDKTGKPITSFSFEDNIKSIKNFPYIANMGDDFDLYFECILNQDIINELSKYSKYNSIKISTNVAKGNIDLTKLNGHINTLRMGGFSQDIKFNESLIVDSFQFWTLNPKARFLNLPLIKENVHFQKWNKDISKLFKNCEGNDKIDLNKVKIFGGRNEQDREDIKNHLFKISVH